MSATPILDLEQEPPKPPKPPKAAGRVWRIVAGLAIGAIAGNVAPAVEDFWPHFPSFNIFVWILALHVMILLHECGHLVAGMLAGLPPGGMRVGCFALIRSGDRWIFRFEPRRFLSGMAIPLPPEGGAPVSSLIWMVAGGPLASVAVMAVCWAAWLKYGDGNRDWIGSVWWAAFACLSCLIPMSNGLMKSDISRLWMFWRHPDETESWVALVAVNAENLRGVRPRDWMPSLAGKMSARDPKDRSIQAELFLYCRCWDEGDFEGALQHLETCLALSGRAGKGVRKALFFEAAAASAFRRRDAAHARTWRERAEKLGKFSAVPGAGSAAAVAMCEGRYEDALREIEEARRVILRRNPGSGVAVFAREQLNAHESECRRALAGSAASSAGA
ncbi:MAG TPA: hypothetical protein VHC90_12435 [Bryobacteraceae bacterium]|nr:hypothetical protein [Bryobacteraceae bacterium]